MNSITRLMLAGASVIGITALLTGCGNGSPDLYKDASQPVEKRVENLLSQMTLDEKIGQLNQRSMWEGDEALAHFTQEISDGNIGSLLNVPSAAFADSMQRVAMERTRLGIPLLISRDVIHGYKTIFPIPLGQAATFDTTIVEQAHESPLSRHRATAYAGPSPR